MPNPLTQILQANPEGAKPSAIRGRTEDSQKSISFQDVLSKDTLIGAVDAEAVVVQSDDVELELGSEFPEAEVEDPTLSPEQIEGGDNAIDRNPEADPHAAEPSQNGVVKQVAESAISEPNPAESNNPSWRAEFPVDRRSSPEPNAVSPKNTAPIGQQQDAMAKRREPSVSPQQTVHQAMFLKAANPTPESASGEGGHRAPFLNATTVPEIGLRMTPMTANTHSALPFNVTVAASESTASEPGTLFADDIGGTSVQRETLQAQAARDFAPLTASTAARAEVTRAIAGQMAAVITAKPGSGGVEIALNPEELGRVSITLNGREDGLILSIAVERPETLDLLRRHITTLTAEFQKAGYDDLTFDLGSSDGGWHDSSPEQDGAAFAQDTPEDSPKTAQNSHTMASGRGLDMRL